MITGGSRSGERGSAHFPAAGLASDYLLLHISCVRGSPLFRTFVILVVIVAAGFFFVRLTAAPKAEASNATESSDRAEGGKKFISAKVYVTFSSPVEFTDLKSGDMQVALDSKGAGAYEFTAAAMVDPKNPVMFLKAACAVPSGGRLFAKLVVEADGRETFTHFFEADGDIDDFIELPF